MANYDRYLRDEKVLVCLLASTRAYKLTFPGFQRHVLDELGGDLALSLVNDEVESSNPFWQRAKYRWTVPTFDDYGNAFDFAQHELCRQLKIAPPNWRVMLQLKGIWQGGIKTEDSLSSASSISLFCRWLLLNGLQKNNVLDRYDRFIITRSDFLWLCPHPPLSVLDRDKIWVPRGEDYGGLNDRHLVASRADVVNCLNIIEDIVLQPASLYEEMKGRNHPDWNNESFLAHHLRRKRLLNKVRRFPYVMYLARPADETGPTFSPGRFEPAVGHYIKYEEEYRAARACAKLIRRRSDWENGLRHVGAETYVRFRASLRRRMKGITRDPLRTLTRS
jgi:hypothetical protein